MFTKIEANTINTATGTALRVVQYGGTSMPDRLYCDLVLEADYVFRYRDANGLAHDFNGTLDSITDSANPNNVMIAFSQTIDEKPFAELDSVNKIENFELDTLNDIMLGFTTNTVASILDSTVNVEFDSLELFAAEVSGSGSYKFIFDGSDWTLSAADVDLADYGLVVNETPVENDSFTVEYTAAGGTASIGLSTIITGIVEVA